MTPQRALDTNSRLVGRHFLSDADALRREPVLEVEREGDARVVKLGGELDLYNAPQVRQALVEACADAPGRVVVDLSEVEFVDSTALGVLIEARSKVGRDGLLLAAPQPEARRTLQVSGLDRHLPVHDSVDEALAAAS